MVAEIGADNCCTVELTVEVFVVLINSKVIHKNTVMKVNSDIKNRSRSLFCLIVSYNLHGDFD